MPGGSRRNGLHVLPPVLASMRVFFSSAFFEVWRRAPLPNAHSLGGGVDAALCAEEDWPRLTRAGFHKLCSREFVRVVCLSGQSASYLLIHSPYGFFP